MLAKDDTGSKGSCSTVTEVPTEHAPLLSPNVARANDGRAPRSLRWVTARILIPFFLYCLAVGCVTGPKLTVIVALSCREKETKHEGRINDGDACTDPEVHAKIARFMAVANIISGTLCAICGPRILTLSDYRGRKLSLAISCSGMLLGDLVSLLAVMYPGKVSMAWILLEFVIGGLTGAFATTVALVQLCIADNVVAEHRIAGFGFLHACMYLGMSLGPACGAYFSQLVDEPLLWLFVFAGFCHGLFLLYSCLALPDTRVPSARGPIKYNVQSVHGRGFAALRTHLRWSNLLGPLKILSRHNSLATNERNHTLLALATIDTVAFGIQIGLLPLLVLYSEFRFQWKTFEINTFVSVNNITKAICLTVLLPLLTRTSTNSHSSSISNVFQRNTLVIQISLLLEILGQSGLAVSVSGRAFLVCGALTALGSALSPVAQSMMMMHVGHNHWGRLAGATSFLHSVARALVPALMQLVYGMTLESSSGAVFMMLAGLFALILLLSCAIREDAALVPAVSADEV